MLNSEVVDTDDDSAPDPKNPKKPKIFSLVCAQIPIEIGAPPPPQAPPVDEEKPAEEEKPADDSASE